MIELTDIQKAIIVKALQHYDHEMWSGAVEWGTSNDEYHTLQQQIKELIACMSITEPS